MIPQIDNSTDLSTINLISYPNLTYKSTEYQTAGKIDDLEAIKQSIEHILSIERYAYVIYDDDYGIELEKYIGQSFEFLEATIEDTLKEALLQDDRIVDVQVTNIYKSIQQADYIEVGSSVNKREIVNVEFDVYCKQGIIHTEVKVNV